ncbi:MAG: pilin [Chromatiales bacterium]|nr:pilin [Chromatiales bacterium]
MRAKITEGLNIASAAKATVAENAMAGTTDLKMGWTVPTATTNVKSVDVSSTNGTITITYQPAAKDVVLTLTPLSANVALAGGTIPSDAITWTCKVDTAANSKYVPANCRI